MPQGEGRLAGKRVAVTGAGQGIGAAIVEVLAREGAVVHALSRTLAPMQRWQGIAAIVPRALDVTDRAAVAAAAAAVGPVHVLVNAAGWVPSDRALDSQAETLRRAFEINVVGAVHCVQAFMPGMIAGGGGAIVNIASVVSSIAAATGRFAYGTSKAAMIGMTKSIALDYAAERIRCNAICPGAVHTPSMNARIDGTRDPAASRKAIEGRAKLKRMAEPQEIAEACVYLASDAGAFMTGQTIVIDGGMTVG
ncbi:MAG: SDR family oxidoreductase [Alphaproteobacteria bacterium]|nr:SDR family oxidoreductase [Alphaproteobacteria bacterium]